MWKPSTWLLQYVFNYNLIVHVYNFSNTQTALYIKIRVKKHSEIMIHRIIYLVNIFQKYIKLIKIKSITALVLITVSCPFQHFIRQLKSVLAPHDSQTIFFGIEVSSTPSYVCHNNVFRIPLIDIDNEIQSNKVWFDQLWCS